MLVSFIQARKNQILENLRGEKKNPAKTTWMFKMCAKTFCWMFASIVIIFYEECTIIRLSQKLSLALWTSSRPTPSTPLKAADSPNDTCKCYYMYVILNYYRSPMVIKLWTNRVIGACRENWRVLVVAHTAFNISGWAWLFRKFRIWKT